MILTLLAPNTMDPIQDVKAMDSKTLMASFSLQADATSYIIRIQNANGFYREDTVSMSPAEIRSLTPYTEYTLSVIAVNSAGRSQPSSPVTAKTGTVVLYYLCVQYVRFSCFHVHSWNSIWKKITPTGWFMYREETKYFTHQQPEL